MNDGTPETPADTVTISGHPTAPLSIPPPADSATLSPTSAGGDAGERQLTDPLAGLPWPLIGLPGPLSGLPGPLIGLPGPLIGLPGPLTASSPAGRFA